MANNATAPASTNAQAAAPATSSAFRAQTQPGVVRPGNSQLLTMTTGTQPFSDTLVPPITLLRCIYVEVTATATGNSATVAFEPDAPLNVLSTINFHNSAGLSYVGPFSSYELFVGNKYGGYEWNADLRDNATFSQMSGSGATAGSFKMVLRVPVEVVSRTGVGSLISTNTVNPYTLSMTLNSSTAIYATPPTALPTVSVTVSFGNYLNMGQSTTSFATPNAANSVLFMNETQYSGVNGQQTVTANSLGLGNEILGIDFVNRDTSTGARSATDFPSQFSLIYRGVPIMQLSQNLWQQIMSAKYGYDDPTFDVAKGLDTGVFAWDFITDFIGKPGSTLFNNALSTQEGDSLQYQGTWNNSSTLVTMLQFLAVNGPVSSIQGK